MTTSSANVQRDAQGNAFEMRPIDCPTCGVRDLKTLGNRGGEHHRYGLGFSTAIVECRRCGLLFPDPFPFALAPAELYGDAEKYFGAKAADDARVRVYRGRAADTLAVLGKPCRSMLDIGCGRGEFLEAARLEGVEEVIGIDFSAAFQAEAAKRGVRVELMTIEEFERHTTKRFTVVVLNAVLEHVYRPDQMIAAASRLLEPGGIIYIDVPNEPSLLTTIGNTLSRLRGKSDVLNLAPTFPPYHVFGFNKRSLGVLLEQNGFKVEQVIVRSGTTVVHRKNAKDWVRAKGAGAIMQVANWTGTAGNMRLWARKIA